MNCYAINKEPDKSKFIQKNDPQCNCESVSISKYSPGIVKDDEILIRQIYSPIHIDQETGKITSLTFDDASSKGLSVNRKAHCSLEQLKEKIERKLEIDRERGKMDRRFIGIIYSICGDIRTIKNDNIRGFCVYDTAKVKDISHADICQCVGRSQGSKIRRQLQKAFQDKPVDLESLFDN
jgi:hypothetical protein